MQFKDAIFQNDTIEAGIRDGKYGLLVVVELDVDSIAQNIYLTKEDAAAFGRLLIELSESI
jgi:hypothetical protein